MKKKQNDPDKIRLAVNLLLGWEWSYQKTERCQIPCLWRGRDAYMNREQRDYYYDANTRAGMLAVLNPSKAGPLLKALGATGKAEMYWVDLMTILKIDQPTFCIEYFKLHQPT